MVSARPLRKLRWGNENEKHESWVNDSTTAVRYNDYYNKKYTRLLHNIINLPIPTHALLFAASTLLWPLLVEGEVDDVIDRPAANNMRNKSEVIDQG